MSLIPASDLKSNGEVLRKARIDSTIHLLESRFDGNGYVNPRTKVMKRAIEFFLEHLVNTTTHSLDEMLERCFDRFADEISVTDVNLAWAYVKTQPRDSGLGVCECEKCHRAFVCPKEVADGLKKKSGFSLDFLNKNHQCTEPSR